MRSLFFFGFSFGCVGEFVLLSDMFAFFFFKFRVLSCMHVPVVMVVVVVAAVSFAILLDRITPLLFPDPSRP